ncbi:MAG: SpoIID/LytB domain-containing protein [Actinomycetota bacterium]
MRKAGIVVACALVLAMLATTGAQARRVVTIRGGGWGHGIGMSQYGAYGQALNGRSAKRILEKYYTDAHVATKEMPAKVRVGLMQTRTSIAFRSLARVNGGGEIAVKVEGASGFLARGGTNTQWRIERSPTGGLRLYKNGNRVVRNGRSVFGSTQRPLLVMFERYKSLADVEGKSYNYAYGRLSFGTYNSSSCGSDYCLRLVLSLPMQKYIYGLGEVPASWPGAVLKAQANAGRTYVYSKIVRLGQHLFPCDCAVVDTPADQAYIGDAKRTGSGPYWDEWKGAVDATRGKVVVYKGAPIQALYSSSSGGHTEHNENVWGGTPIPYLRGVPDPADDVPANPNHTWTLKMAWSAFSDKLNAAFGTGKLERFRVVAPRGVSGRVTVVKSVDRGGVRIVGSRKTARADGWDIRSAVGLKDTLFWITVKQVASPAFAPLHESLGGAGGPLGQPTGGGVHSRGLPDSGRMQHFAGGTIYLNPHSDTAHALWGPIDDRYHDMGTATSACGYPLSNTKQVGSEVRARFEHGVMTYSAEDGVAVDCA